MTNQQQEMVEYTIQEVIGYLMDDEQMPMDEAMNKFYTSKTFEKLQDTDTGLYLEGSVYLYDMLRMEQNGQIELV